MKLLRKIPKDSERLPRVTIQDIDKITVHDVQESGSGNISSHSAAPYSCGTWLDRVDFPRVNGENVNQ